MNILHQSAPMSKGNKRRAVWGNNQPRRMDVHDVIAYREGEILLLVLRVELRYMTEYLT